MSTKKKKKPEVVKSLQDIATDEKGKITTAEAVNKRAKQEEMPLKGTGVEVVTDKKLIALGDTFIESRDAKAELATKMTETEAMILNRMDELKLKVFRFGDQIVTAKTGSTHIKIKTVKAEGQDGEGEGPLGEEQ